MIDDIKNGKQVNLSNWTFCIPGVLHKQFQQPLVRRDFAFTITVSCFLIHRKDSCEQKHLITTKPGMFLTSCSSYIAKKRSLATQNWIFTIQKESHEEAFNLKKKKSILLLQTSYQFAVLHPPAWLSWSFHQGRRYKPPSAQLHSWWGAGDPLETDKVPTAAGKKISKSFTCMITSQNKNILSDILVKYRTILHPESCCTFERTFGRTMPLPLWLAIPYGGPRGSGLSLTSAETGLTTPACMGPA